MAALAGVFLLLSFCPRTYYYFLSKVLLFQTSVVLFIFFCNSHWNVIFCLLRKANGTDATAVSRKALRISFIFFALGKHAGLQGTSLHFCFRLFLAKKIF